MTTRNTIVATAVVFTVVGFLLQSNAPIGSMIWPPAEGLPTPDATQIALFMGYGLIAAIGFGLGIAFLAFGRPLLDNLRVSSGMARAMHLAVAWLLLNWVIHDSLHAAVGMNFNGLLAIEYGFHGTLLLGGATLAHGLVQHAQAPVEPSPRPQASPSSETA